MITPFQLEVRQYVKAVVGGLLAALALLGGALGDGLSSNEWVGLVVAFLTGFVGVFYAPNKDPKFVDDERLSTQPGDAGNAYLTTILIAVAVVLVMVFLVLPLLNGASL